MINGKDDGRRTAPDPGNTLFIVYVGFVACLILLSMVLDGYAAVVAGDSGEVSLSEIRQGSLLFSARSDKGGFIAAPQLSQDVEIYISGMTSRTMVRQRFLNRTDQWQEAIYVFPLPDESAVDQLRMKIGDRIIEGEIKEKEEAKKVYEQARKDGKKASLLSQERPNVFTMAVANIGPGEEVEVEIEFQQVVALSDGIFSIHFPWWSLLDIFRVLLSCKTPNRRKFNLVELDGPRIPIGLLMHPELPLLLLLRENKI